MGWQGIQNGQLVRIASEQFELLVTVDSNMAFQTNLKEIPLAVVVFPIGSRDIESYKPFIEQFEKIAFDLPKGEFTILES
jgi:hypothetical protein